jgi:hypothetical protein
LQGCVIVALQGCVIVALQGCVIVALQGCVIIALQCCVIVVLQRSQHNFTRTSSKLNCTTGVGQLSKLATFGHTARCFEF